MAAFTEPLKRVSRKELLLWGSVLILSSVKILWGDHAFFMSTFGDSFDNPERANWWGWSYHFLSSFLLFACIPVLIARSPSIPPIGLGIGDFRFGMKATAVSLVVLLLPAWIGSQDPEHLELYPLSSLATVSTSSFLLWSFLHLLHYIGWELFYRGFIGMGMRPLLGTFGALSFQTLLTTLMHIGKPSGETLGAIVGGVYLGLLTYRTGSIWYAVIFHAYLGTLNTLFCS